MKTFHLRNILHKSELSSQLARWAVNINEFDIEYKPQTAINSYVFSNFMVDFNMGMMPLDAKSSYGIRKCLQYVEFVYRRRF